MRMIPTMLFLFALMVSSFCVKPQHIPTEEEKEQALMAKNNVGRMEVFNTRYLLGMPQAETLSELDSFDAKGRKVRQVIYNPDSSIESITRFEYDGDKLLLTEAMKADSSFLFREIRTYDERGNRIELKSIPAEFKDSYKFRNVAEYDRQGRMTRLSWYRPDGLKAVHRYGYDGDRKTEDWEYDPQERLRYSWRYGYDPDGNRTEAVQQDTSGKVITRMEYAYDSHHRPVRETTYYGEEMNGYVTFEYGDNGLLKQKTEFSPAGKISTVYRYAYSPATRP